MVSYLAVRAVTLLTGVGHDSAVLLAAVATQDSSSNLVKAAIVTGVFTVLVALISAAAVLIRARNPDLSELLALHERVAVNERNIADLHTDVRQILDRLDKRRGH